MNSQVGIFEVEGTPDQVQAVRNGLARCDYPWERLLPGVYERALRAPRVKFTSIPGYGMYRPWDVTLLITDKGSMTSWRSIFLMEIAHAVDYLTLTQADQMALHTLFHGGDEVHNPWRTADTYANRAAEAFMYAFMRAFAPTTTEKTTFGHHDISDVDTIREIVLRRKIVAFSDIDGHTHQEAIEWAARNGLIKGKDGKAEPNEPVTRGQLMTILKQYHEQKDSVSG